jgi:large subunit ribosomal protein L4
MPSISIQTLDLKDNQKSTTSLDYDLKTEKLSSHAWFLNVNQKNNRKVYSSTKSRSDFESGGRKPFKQKGTGRARSGSSRSPLKVGGSVIFGPHPRDVRRKINSRLKLDVLKQILLEKASQSFVLNHVETVTKARQFAMHLDMSKNYLVILDLNSFESVNFFMAVKNIPNLYFNSRNSVVIEDLLNADHVVYTPEVFNSFFSGDSNDN